MKIIKDEEIEKIIDTHNDYKIKSTISDVYNRLEMKQQLEILKKPAKPSKKQLIYGSLLGSLTGLVVAGLSIFVVYNTQNNQVSRTNISSDISFLKDENRSQVLGKELLLFNMTKKDQRLKEKIFENYSLNPDSNLLENNIFGHIIAGFENIAPIIFNQISSFDSITNKVITLNNPTMLGKVSFKNRYVSTYNQLDFSYYFNDDNSTDYGISLIGDEYYKTYIYEIKNKSKLKTEIYLEGIDNSTLFKISEEDGINSFNYRKFKNLEDVKKDKYSFYYDVDLGSGTEASNFTIKSYNQYEISYDDITLKDLLKILFNVNYLDTVSNLKYNFEDCLCKAIDAGKNQYQIGKNEISF